eukprot:757283-Hanusia_phi.AAC.1
MCNGEGGDPGLKVVLTLKSYLFVFDGDDVQENSEKSEKALREAQLQLRELQEKLKFSELKLKEMKQSNESRLKKEQVRLEQIKIEMQKEFDEKLRASIDENHETWERYKEEWTCNLRQELSDLNLQKKYCMDALNHKANELQNAIASISLQLQSVSDSANQELHVLRCDVRHQTRAKTFFLKRWFSRTKTRKILSKFLLKSQHKLVSSFFLKWKILCVKVTSVLDLAKFVRCNMIGLSRTHRGILCFHCCDLNHCLSLKKSTVSVEETVIKWRGSTIKAGYMNKLDVIFRKNIIRRILDVWTIGKLLGKDRKFRVKISRKLCRAGHLRTTNSLFAAWSRFVRTSTFFYHKTSQRTCQRCFKSWSSLARMKAKLFSFTDVKLLRRCFKSSYSFFQRWKSIFSLKIKKTLSLKMNEKKSLKVLQTLMMQWATRARTMISCKLLGYARDKKFTSLCLRHWSTSIKIESRRRLSWMRSRARLTDFVCKKIILVWKFELFMRKRDEEFLTNLTLRRERFLLKEKVRRWASSSQLMNEMYSQFTASSLVQNYFSLSYHIFAWRLFVLHQRNVSLKINSIGKIATVKLLHATFDRWKVSCHYSSSYVRHMNSFFVLWRMSLRSKVKENAIASFALSKSSRAWLRCLVIIWRKFASFDKKNESFCMDIMKRKSHLSILLSFKSWKNASLSLLFHLAQMNVDRRNYHNMKKIFGFWLDEIESNKLILQSFRQQRGGKSKFCTLKVFLTWVTCNREAACGRLRSEVYIISQLKHRTMRSYWVWRDLARQKRGLHRLFSLLLLRIHDHRKKYVIVAMLKHLLHNTNLYLKLEILVEKFLRRRRSAHRSQIKLDFTSPPPNLQVDGFKFVRKSQFCFAVEDEIVSVLLPLSCPPRLLLAGEEHTALLFVHFQRWKQVKTESPPPSLRFIALTRSRRFCRCFFLAWHEDLQRRRRQVILGRRRMRRGLAAVSEQWRLQTRACHRRRRILSCLVHRKSLRLLSSSLETWRCELAMQQGEFSARRLRQGFVDRVQAMCAQEDSTWVERFFQRWQLHWMSKRMRTTSPPLPPPPPPPPSSDHLQSVLELFLPFTQVRSYRNIAFSLWMFARPMPAALLWARLLRFLLYKHKDYRICSVLAAWKEESEKKVRRLEKEAMLRRGVQERMLLVILMTWRYCLEQGRRGRTGRFSM